MNNKNKFAPTAFLPGFILLLFSVSVCGFLYVFVDNYTIPLYSATVASLGLEMLFMPFFVLKFEGEGTKSVVAKSLVTAIVGLGVSMSAAYLFNTVLQIGNAKSALIVLGICAAVIFVPFIIWLAHLKRQSKPVRLFTVVALLICLAAITYEGCAYTVISEGGKAHYDVEFTDKIEQSYGIPQDCGSGLVVNIDCNSVVVPFLNSVVESENVVKESLYAFVDQYSGTQVTDITFDVFCQFSNTPSDFWTTSAEKFLQTEENGVPVDYSEIYASLYKLYTVHNIDPYEIWFERCAEKGLNAWLSIRMNDCHDSGEETSFLRSSFFYEALENGWLIGDDYGYFKTCYDYSVPQVREKMLSYIGEQLMRYDVYGLELDFMREIYCFDYMNMNEQEISEIMTQFMRDTNEIVNQAEEHWGHEIKIMTRLTRDLDQSRRLGFDAEAWSRESLTDIIVVTPRWSSNDSAMPIADWEKRCGGIEIYAGLETLTNYDNTSVSGAASPSNARGLSAQYLSAGADKIYLFNYFMNPLASAQANARNTEIINTCGSADTSVYSQRSHVVTYQDIAPEGWEKYDPLPMTVDAGSTDSLKVETGYIPSGSEVKILIGTDTPDAIGGLQLTLCGKTCDFTGKTVAIGLNEAGQSAENIYVPDNSSVYGFSLSDPQELPNYLTLDFNNTGTDEINITYVEITVSPVNNSES